MQVLPSFQMTMMPPSEAGIVGKPKTRLELRALMRKGVEKYGNTCNLNGIDVSRISDFSNLFSQVPGFNGNISRWDVSNVTDMEFMFAGSSFNGDISKWDVSSVVNMGNMFDRSAFNNEISRWNVSCATDMSCMFSNSVFNQDISGWNVSNVQKMTHMFAGGQFNGDVSAWDVANVQDFESMFWASAFAGDLSRWQVTPNACMDNALPRKSMRSMPTCVFHWVYALDDPTDAWLTEEQRQHWTEMFTVALALALPNATLAHWMHEQWRIKGLAHPQYELPALDMEP